MSCHAGTHLDGPGHFLQQPGTRYAGEIPLGEGRLVGRGVVVDISTMIEDYGIYGKREIVSAGVEVRKGDILIIHTGYHRFQKDLPGESEVRYFFRHRV
jgi:arylformamidase